MRIWTKVLATALFGIPGLIAAFVIDAILSEDDVRERLQEDDAFYGQIKAIQPKVLTLEEIDEEGDSMGLVGLESTSGVSDDLYEGEIIYAYA